MAAQTISPGSCWTPETQWNPAWNISNAGLQCGVRGWQAASPSACPNFGNGATKPVALYNLSEPGQMQTDANKVVSQPSPSRSAPVFHIAADARGGTQSPSPPVAYPPARALSRQSPICHVLTDLGILTEGLSCSDLQAEGSHLQLERARPLPDLEPVQESSSEEDLDLLSSDSGLWLEEEESQPSSPESHAYFVNLLFRHGYVENANRVLRAACKGEVEPDISISDAWDKISELPKDPRMLHGVKDVCAPTSKTRLLVKLRKRQRQCRSMDDASSSISSMMSSFALGDNLGAFIGNAFHKAVRELGRCLHR